MGLLDNPSVGQANQALRARANDAAWWLRHWAKALDEGRGMPSDSASMFKMADALEAGVKAANDAADREAFRT